MSKEPTTSATQLFYEENWYFVAFIPRLIKHDFVAGKCLAEDFIADLEDF